MVNKESGGAVDMCECGGGGVSTMREHGLELAGSYAHTHRPLPPPPSTSLDWKHKGHKGRAPASTYAPSWLSRVMRLLDAGAGVLSDTAMKEGQ